MKAIFDQRENNIDFVRIVLALLVILSHSYPLTLGHERTEPFAVISRLPCSGEELQLYLASPHQDRTTVYVKDLTRDESRVSSA